MAAEVTIEDLAAGTGQVLSSPRSLAACTLEGVVPEKDLAVKTEADFPHCTDRDELRIRLAHCASRRRKLIDRVCKRRALLMQHESQCRERSESPTEKQSSSPASHRSHSQTEKSARRSPNVNWKEQKEQIVRSIQARWEKQEADRERWQEKEEIARRVREAMARRRDVENVVHRARKEKSMEKKQEEAFRRLDAKLEQMARRDAQRVAWREAEQRKREEASITKQQQVDQRTEAIRLQGETLMQMRRRLMEERLKHAEENYEKRCEEKERELKERKERSEYQMHEFKKKRRQVENQKEKYIQKLKHQNDEIQRRLSEREAQEEANHHRHQVEERLRLRRKEETLQEIRERESAKTANLEQHIETEEERFARRQEERRREKKMKLLELELKREDRFENVERMRKVLEHLREEADLQYRRKLQRVEEQQSEARATVERRTKERHEAERVATDISLAATPGPCDYHAAEAEKFLSRSGGGFRMGKPSYRRQWAEQLGPGPGAYSLSYISAINPKRGIVLPKRRVAPASATPSTSIARSPRSYQSSTPGLPPLKRGGRGSPHHTDDSHLLSLLSQEDYDSSEDFEHAEN